MGEDRLAAPTKKALLSWSSGKDSALALYEIRKRQDYEIVALLTTLTEEYDRVSMHGVRRELLDEQARSLGLPLEIVLIHKNASNDEYEQQMGEALDRYRSQGVHSVVFGDIFLADIRKYREDNLAKAGMQAVFPLWNQDTRLLIHNLLDAGFRAITTCVDTYVLGQEYAGREIDEAFIASLPEGIDPCGENGEFHTFVYEGPIFSKAISLQRGEKVLRENRFFYCDLLPCSNEQ